MTNWKKVKITHASKSNDNWGNKCIDFHLDSWIEYKEGGGYPYILCVDCHPFNSYQIGDYLEIDMNITRNFKCGSEFAFSNPGVVRKVSSSSSSTNIITASGSSSNIVVSPSAANFIASQDGLNLARGMSRMVDETGKNFEYKIEVETKDGRKISHSLICRKD